MLAGPNLKAMEEMVKAVNIEVIASGGVRNIDDIRNLKTWAFPALLSGRHCIQGFGFERSHRSGEIRGELNGHKKNNSCLDVHNGRVVKGVNFVNIRDAGDPVEIASYYDKAGADELTFLDITASAEARNIMIDVVRRVAEQVFIPFTVGGGIRTVEDFREILKAGADKVSINSAAVKRPELISEAASRFGSQCVVVAIDAKRRDDNSGWDVYINGGRINTGKDAVEWAVEVEKLGAGEILLTSMDCDGTKKGYDIELTRKVSESVRIPVIASAVPVPWSISVKH